jgi:hypothetical protein
MTIRAEQTAENLHTARLRLPDGDFRFLWQWDGDLAASYRFLNATPLTASNAERCQLLERHLFLTIRILKKIRQIDTVRRYACKLE